MNKRQIAVKVGLNKAEMLNKLPLTQGDRNSHSFSIAFIEEIELTDYQLLVFYQLPDSAPIRTVVDKYQLTEEKRTLNIVIPTKALEKTGELIIEFALKHNTTDNYLTINENLKLEVIGTINGAMIKALPAENLQLSIDEQIAKIEYLLKVADGITNDFNENATDKTNLFNNNYNEKIQAFDKNANDNATAFNQFVSKTLEGAYKNLDSVALTSAEKAATAAKEKVKVQETSSIKNIQDTTTEEVEKAIKNIESAKSESVTAAQSEIKTYVDTNSKSDINNYVDSTSKADIKNYVDTTSKSELDTYVESVSKKGIDNYVIEKEKEIKGATYTPTISPEGILSFENDKNLANPEPVNIMGPVGPVGPKPVKSVDYYTKEEEDKFTAETLELITTEGSNQMSLINQNGGEKVTEILSQGKEQVNAIVSKGNQQTSRVTTEGSKQVGIVTNQGNIVINDLKKLLPQNPTAGDATAVGGKTRAEIERDIREVAGGYKGEFPLTSAIKGGVYLVPTTGKFYICREAYSGIDLSEPNGNFEEFSLASLDKKIDNSKIKKYGVKFSGSNPKGIRTFDAVGMVANVGVDEQIVVNDFDNVSFFDRPVCCGTFNESGEFLVNAYEGEPGFARDGSNGDVYYECTPFYWNGSFEEPVVSASKFEGSMLAPMFNNADDKVYLPCYWASLTSDGKYRSISGVYPNWSSLNGHMEKCRKTNANAHTETIKAHMSEYVLQLVEFATKDLQSVMMGNCNCVYENANYVTSLATTSQTYVIMAKDKAIRYVVGQTIIPSGSWSSTRTITKIVEHDSSNSAIHFEGQEPLSVEAGVKISAIFCRTGLTDNVKASSGSNVSNTDGKHQCKWRGKEAPWADGFSGLCDILRQIEDDGKHYPYLLLDPKKYNNGTLTSDYVKLGYTVPAEGGYAKLLGVNKHYPYAAITTEIGASSVTYLSAYYWNNTNNLTCAYVGGYWYSGRVCSPVCSHLGISPSFSNARGLARLLVTPV